MTKEEKINFVTTLSNSVIDDVIKKINDEKIPEDWNGFQLRVYLRDKFQYEMFSLTKKGIKDYENTVITNNL